MGGKINIFIELLFTIEICLAILLWFNSIYFNPRVTSYKYNNNNVKARSTNFSINNRIKYSNIGIISYSTQRKTKQDSIKVIITKKSFLVTLRAKLSKKSFWFSLFTTIILGLVTRYYLLTYLDLNVAKEISELSFSGISYT